MSLFPNREDLCLRSLRTLFKVMILIQIKLSLMIPGFEISTAISIPQSYFSYSSRRHKDAILHSLCSHNAQSSWVPSYHKDLPFSPSPSLLKLASDMIFSISFHFHDIVIRVKFTGCWPVKFARMSECSSLFHYWKLIFSETNGSFLFLGKHY